MFQEHESDLLQKCIRKLIYSQYETWTWQDITKQKPADGQQHGQNNNVKQEFL